MDDSTATGPDRYFVRADPGADRPLAPGISFRATAGDGIMLSLVTFEPDAVIGDHAHPHEQMGMMISGQLEFSVNGVTETLQAGDIWRIPGGVRHSARAVGGPAVALDVFHPIREDFLT